MDEPPSRLTTPSASRLCARGARSSGARVGGAMPLSSASRSSTSRSRSGVATTSSGGGRVNATTSPTSRTSWVASIVIVKRLPSRTKAILPGSRAASGAPEPASSTTSPATASTTRDSRHLRWVSGSAGGVRGVRAGLELDRRGRRGRRPCAGPCRTSSTPGASRSHTAASSAPYSSRSRRLLGVVRRAAVPARVARPQVQGAAVPDRLAAVVGGVVRDRVPGAVGARARSWCRR